MIAEHPHPAIPIEVLKELSRKKSTGLPLTEAVKTMRSRLVPIGHTPYPFRSNIPETFLDCLRSLISTFFFRHSIAMWKEKGVDFSTYVYVPEVDPITGIVHHEREDHCHILKRIAKHTREGSYMALNLDAFDEAMQDSKTGLTHTALVGKRKQSVIDAEKLLSFHVAAFLDEKGYKREAEYVQIVAKWHEASDGRGVTQLNRCRANYSMLNYLMEELIPWYNENNDLSSIDINRYCLYCIINKYIYIYIYYSTVYIQASTGMCHTCSQYVCMHISFIYRPFQGIRGYSRETFIAITTNIESQEFRRRENETLGYEEHPRAGSTDDVECFFSLCHQKLGCTFTLKEFKYHWRKICRYKCCLLLILNSPSICKNLKPLHLTNLK